MKGTFLLPKVVIFELKQFFVVKTFGDQRKNKRRMYTMLVGGTPQKLYIKPPFFHSNFKVLFLLS